MDSLELDTKKILNFCKSLNEDFIVKIPNEGDVNFKEEDKVKLSWSAKDIRALDLL